MDIAHLYDMVNPVLIKRKSSFSDGMGGKTLTFPVINTIYGRIRPLKGSEIAAGGKILEDSTHRLYCEIIDIQRTDQIEYKLETYEVTYIRDPMNMGEFLEIDLRLML